jgi:hypothetical protein
MTGAEMLSGQGEEVHEEPQTQVAEKAKPAVSESEKALKLQLRNERQSRQDAENNARYWHEKAQQSAAAPAVPAKKEAKEENPSDFIEQLTERGSAAIDDLLAERGYVRKEEVEARITHARNQVTVESALARDYPDLQDSESEFFKETAAQYQTLIAETPELKGNPRTMRLAAKLAAAEFGDAEPERKAPKKGKVVPIVEDDDEDDDEQEDTPENRETSRVRRVQSQSVTGRRVRRETGDDDGLDRVQKGIVANLRAAGANITEESLIKRIQGGTKLSGRIGMAAAAMRRAGRR